MNIKEKLKERIVTTCDESPIDELLGEALLEIERLEKWCEYYEINGGSVPYIKV